MWGGIAGFGLTVGVIFFLRDYLLYMVKAGQIAVMVEYLDGKPLPYGQGQIAYARRVVSERFGQASALFALDRLVQGDRSDHQACARRDDDPADPGDKPIMGAVGPTTLKIAVRFGGRGDSGPCDPHAVGERLGSGA